MAREHLQLIQPLAYRLEIMEDIFSLIFSTHEDLLSHTNDSESEENDSKRSSVTDMTHDSVNVSIFSEEDAGADDSVFLNSKLTRQKSFPCSTSLSNSAPGVDYDMPFVDLVEQKKPTASQNLYDSDPTANNEEVFKSHLKDEVKNLTKKFRKRRKQESLSDSSSMIFQGFIGNEYLVRDILSLLKDAVSDLNTAKNSLYGKDVGSSKKDNLKASPVNLNLDLENALEGCKLTTISQEALQVTYLMICYYLIYKIC